MFWGNGPCYTEIMQCNINLHDDKNYMMSYASDNILLMVEQEGLAGEKKAMALL